MVHTSTSRTWAFVVLVGLSAVGCAPNVLFDEALYSSPHFKFPFSGASDSSEASPEAPTEPSHTPAAASEQQVPDVSAAAAAGPSTASMSKEQQLTELQVAKKAVESLRKQRGGQPIAPIAPIAPPSEATIEPAAYTTSATPGAMLSEASDNPLSDNPLSDNPLRDVLALSGAGTSTRRNALPRPATSVRPPVPVSTSPPAVGLPATASDTSGVSAASEPAEPSSASAPSSSPSSIPDTEPANDSAFERKSTVEQQFRLAQSLDTEAAYQAVSAYFPPDGENWKNRHFAAQAANRIEELRNGADSRDTSNEPGPGKWKTQLGHAIESLEIELAQKSLDAAESARAEAALRLLYLVDNQRQQAARPIEHLDPAEQSFWQHQLFGLAVYMDESGTPVEDNRNTLALRELRKATAELAAATGKLDVRNLAFCTQVQNYGCFTEFDKAHFTPDQEVVLYCEVDNFSTKELPDGNYLTSIQGSYQIYAADGRRVADHTFPLQKETCRNPRRDYFIPYRMWIPKSNVFPGNYTLQLTLEDSIGEKFGQASIDFVVKEPRPTSHARRP